MSLVDWKLAVRRLYQAKSLPSLVVLTLGLAIGATTTVFSALDHLLFEPLPYSDADRLVLLWQSAPGLEREWFSPPQFRDIREQTHSFADLALLVGGPSLLNRDGPPEHSGYLQASASFLRMLGVKPLLGRLLSEEDEREEAKPVVLITYGLWQRRFGGDPEILGKTIGIERFDVPVVGVLPPGLVLDDEIFPNREPIGRVETVSPMRLSSSRWEEREMEMYSIVGKLAPGVSLAEARAELDIIAARLPPNGPVDLEVGIHVQPLLDFVVGDWRRHALHHPCRLLASRPKGVQDRSHRNAALTFASHHP